MAHAKTRSQFVHIEVKRLSSSYSRYDVTLCGPTEVLRSIGHGVKNCAINSHGSCMKITLTGSDSKYMKLTLLEEVLKLGFILSSNVKDNSLFLSREVKL